MPAGDEDIVRLDVAVHDTVLVRVRERVTDVAQNEHRVLHRQPAVVHEPLAQRAVFLVRHDVVQESVGLPRIVERHDVRMVETRGDLDLAQEALAAQCKGHLPAHHFDRDVTRVFEVVREIHRGHAAAPHLPRDAIALGERSRESYRLLIGQRGKGWAVANSALGSERGVAFPMKEQMVLGARLNQLTACFRAQRHPDPALRLRVVDDVILSEIFRLLNLRTLTMVARGEEIGTWSSLIKLSWSRLAQHLSETALDAHGLAGIAGDPELSFEFLRYRMASIAGGTSEIQRNIVAERILGLPR